ncbi:phage terminase large subunit family protein [Paracoccus sp. MBLB3053]|uniref:Phage terminase large subunit family protein n=1 Tax=Paracoccus aurantius TaxID=3073814 RepID=A0ABU2HT41_9RHOB|nr:terminase gpA endonuclease subunit [Paracoccus sp. MBLB3053]MDS9468203.1 phage terminase large subunit family protein [Paracoccus sp. MBLB3053]
MRTLESFEPLPPYADPRIGLKHALPAWRPAEKISVTEAAEKYMRVNVSGQWQPFRRDVTPYMVEPSDMIATRAYRGLAFCGPSQSGKTQMLQSAIAYTICADPGRVALFQMTREAAAEFERNKIAPMVRNSPELRNRQSQGRGADNIYHKLFSGGTQLTLDWPTITKLSSATIRLVLGTDYDHFPESIDGEGDAYSLMRARARTYLSRGMVVVESSPGAPLKDETWRPVTPHDCPPVAYGVLSLYPDGTRGRWYWPCPHCEAELEPTFRRLRYPDSADPMEAGEAAEMICPHCGFGFGHELKRELNGAGRWLHESRELDELGLPKLVAIDSGLVRRTDMLSYWLDGAAAAFSSWRELVTTYLQAVRTFEATGDEEKLKTAMNTGQAQPYFPRSAISELEVTVQGLREKARGLDLPKGVAPHWTRYITVSVDVQGTRFVVGATAWGENGQHMPIDRFDLFQAPGDADRTIKPFELAEDWAVLEPLADRYWPISGTDGKMKPVAIAIDMHGGGATTDNAYRFYRARRRAGQGGTWFLTRGEGGLKRPDRVWLKAPESASQKSNKRRRVAKDINILFMATDRLKDAVMASLRAEAGMINACLIPEWMGDDHLTEFTAERRLEDGWAKRPGMVRNESLDHLVQARALHILKGGERIDWADPMDWSSWSEKNLQLALTVPSEEPDGSIADAPDASRVARQEPPKPVRPSVAPHSLRPAPGRGGWIQNRGKWL